MADKDGTLVEDLADHMSKVSSLATLSVQSLTIPFLPPCFNHEEVLFLLRKQRKVLTIFKKCRRSCCYFRHLSTLMTRPTSCYCSQNWFAMAWPDLISSHCLTPILSRHDHPCCRWISLKHREGCRKKSLKKLGILLREAYAHQFEWIFWVFRKGVFAAEYFGSIFH